jgi:hypothetical protein
VQRLEIANGTDLSKPAPRTSSDWFSGDLLETLPAAVYVCNAEAVVVAYNGRGGDAHSDHERGRGAHVNSGVFAARRLQSGVE